MKSPFAWKTNSPSRTFITSPTGTSFLINLVLPGFSGSGTRPLNIIELISPDILNHSSSLLIRSKILPRISVIFTFCPFSWVLKRCPSSVGVNAVQNPDVLEATSDLNEVVISAINGTTQITKIIASIIWANERLYMTE